MPTTPPINIPITAQDKTRAAFKSVNDRMELTRRTASGLTSALAAVGGVGGMGVLIKTSIDAADNIGALNKRLGASTEALSEYQYVAKQSKVTFETLTMGWQRMTRRIAEAVQGKGEAKGALEELRLEAAELNKLAPEDQFERIADALSGVTSEGDRVRLAMKLFDSEGVALVQTMTNGAQGIRAMRQEARELGLTLSQEDTRAAAEFNQQLNKVKASATGLGMAMTRNLLPALNEVTAAMAEAAKDGGPIKAFWVGMGGAASQLLFGNELKQAKTDVENLTNEYERIAQNLKTANQRGAITQFLFGGKEEIQSELNRVAGELVQAKLRLQALLNPAQPTPGGDQPTPGGVIPVPGAASDADAEKAQRDAEQKQREAFMERQKAFDNAMLEHKQTHYDTVLDMEASHLRASAEQLSAHNEWVVMSEREKASAVLGQFQALTAGVAQHSKAMFKINKVAAIADTILNMHEAIAGAYAWGAKRGGPPLGAAMATVAAVAQIARVQAIRSTSFSGGGGGTTPSSAGSVPTINDNPVPQNAAQSAPARQVNINVRGSVFDGNTVRELIEQINEQLGDGATLNLDYAPA